jgi:hypothetical protein
MSGGFRFLDLSPEIRNLIYKEVLVIPDGILLYHNRNSNVLALLSAHAPRWVALLRANRQIYREARPILYRYNTFALKQRAHQYGVLSCFLDCIGPENVGLLRRLAMDFLNVGYDGPREDDEAHFEELRVLRRCTNLETIQNLKSAP